MTEATKLVWRRSVILWFGAGLVMWLNSIAVMVANEALTYATLAANATFALFGVAFGIWVGQTLAKSTT
jgi:hypothetical protein